MIRFSIILPTYRRNHSGLLEKSIRSVLTQTFSDFELLIVDDGSQDGTADTIKYFSQNDSRIKHIRFESNVGLPALTCAKAFLQSRGQLIAWMFDDCEWTSTYLAEMSEFFKAKPDIRIAWAKCEAHFSSGSRIFGGPLDRENMLAGNNHVPNIATIIDRSVFNQVGWYDPRIILVRHNDWDFLQRCIREDIKLEHYEKVLCHEYGVSLPDSLGNCYDTHYDLVKIFASSDRKKELHPERVALVEVISIPEGVELEYELRQEYIRLLIEFAILTSRDDLLKSICDSGIFCELGESWKSSSQTIKWWARFTVQKYRSQIRDKDIEIQKKQSFIDKQQAYINEQQAYIDKLKSNL